MIPTLALDLVILVFMDDYASRSNLRQFKYSTVPGSCPRELTVSRPSAIRRPLFKRRQRAEEQQQPEAAGKSPGTSEPWTASELRERPRQKEEQLLEQLAAEAEFKLQKKSSLPSG